MIASTVALEKAGDLDQVGRSNQGRPSLPREPVLLAIRIEAARFCAGSDLQPAGHRMSLRPAGRRCRANLQCDHRGWRPRPVMQERCCLHSRQTGKTGPARQDVYRICDWRQTRNRCLRAHARASCPTRRAFGIQPSCTASTAQITRGTIEHLLPSATT